MSLAVRDAAAGPASSPAGVDRKLTLSLPGAVVRQLRERMAADDTTMRALILEALRSAGYAVSDREIRDRRRSAGR
jgi:ADP-ribosylglycohydrolase